MKYLLCVVLLFISSAYGLTLVQGLDNITVIQGNTYVAKLNFNEDTITINNVVELPMLPRVSSGNNVLGRVSPRYTKSVLASNPSSFTVEYLNAYVKNEEVFTSATITLKEDYIEQTIVVENNGDIEKSVSVEILPNSPRNAHVFTPYVTDESAKFLSISPSKYGIAGSNLVVSFVEPVDDPLPVLKPAKELYNVTAGTMENLLVWNVNMPVASSYVISTKYQAGYLCLKEEAKITGVYSASLGEEPFVYAEDDFLINLVNLEQGDATLKGPMGTVEAATDLESAKSAVESTIVGWGTIGSGQFDQIPEKVDFSSLVVKREELNSLERSLVAKRMYQLIGVPAKLRVGKDGNRYYAWVEVKGRAYDAFRNTDLTATYSSVYSEPAPITCTSAGIDNKMQSCPWARGVGLLEICLGGLCISPWMLIALFLIILVAAFLVLQFKTGFVYSVILKRNIDKEIQLSEAKDSADFAIVNPKYEPGDPLRAAVWREINKMRGNVSIKEIAKSTEFSEPLVRGVIDELLEKSVIKRQ
jgi:hypothetical protein